MSMVHTAYIGLGSNLGDRRSSIEAAVERLRATEGIEEVLLSSLYETEPVGGPSGQGPYLNAAGRVRTMLRPHELLAVLLRIERELGRKRRERWGPRTIDLDLLLYEDQILDTPSLTLPHPRMHEREFVLGPLAEIAPDAMHPTMRLTIAEMLRRLSK